MKHHGEEERLAQSEVAKEQFQQDGMRRASPVRQE
jgi:hypothetical protein